MTTPLLRGALALSIIFASLSIAQAQSNRRVNRVMESEPALTDGLRYVYQPEIKIIGVKGTEIINKKFVEAGSFGTPGELKYADLAITLTIQHWCGKLDRKDIVKLVEDDGTNANTKNKIMQISIRETRDYNMYGCAGGGNEQQDVLVVLPLINGISQFFDQDRISAYNVLGKSPSGVQVKVLYNQAKQTFNIQKSN